MNELHLPWLESAILLPLIGAAVVCRLRDLEAARKWSVVFTGLAAICAISASFDFSAMHLVPSTLVWEPATDRWDLATHFLGRKLFVLDELNLPLLPLVALLFFLTALATLRIKVRRFSFGWALFSEAITLATFCCNEPWGIIALMAVATVPPFFELRARGKPTRVYAAHMLAFVILLVLGWSFVQFEGTGQRIHSLTAVIPLLGAVLIRSGMVPMHCWVTDLFEHATFGTSLLYVTPMVGALAAVRLVLPVAPDWVLKSIGLISLFTAVYSAGMALVQQEARRFFCYLFLSHSALVLVGLEMVSPLGLTGGLVVWLSTGLSLGGFGLTLRALEARRGRLPLSEYQGLYEHTPALAICFLLTGLASVGFPGTFGFIGTELLVDGAVETYPYVGVAVVVAAAMNGIAIVQAYFRLFTGTRYASSVPLQIGARERFGVLALAGLILGGGLIPQPGVASRHHAAAALLRERAGAPPAKPNTPVHALKRGAVRSPQERIAEAR